jgi:hypothetical protein
LVCRGGFGNLEVEEGEFDNLILEVFEKPEGIEEGGFDKAEVAGKFETLIGELENLL